jgi:uncharacterized protein DUF72
VRTNDEPEAGISAREKRRSSREARRAKQRSENLGRAARMHAARLEWEQDANAISLQTTRFELPRVNVGCSGWFYWHWRGKFYGDLPTTSWFAHYADHFRTVELNAPFYSWPTPVTVCGWRRQAGRRKFVYTVKVSELITHVKRFHRNARTHPRLRPYRRPPRCTHGLLSLSATAELSFQSRAAGPHHCSTRPDPAQCRGISASNLVERARLRRF